MADEVQQQEIALNSNFYRDHYHHILLVLMGTILLMMLVLSVVLYQVMTRPMPQFTAIQPDGKKLLLIPYDEPNLLPDTILRWASKAATAAYTFDFNNYEKQVGAARIYFTNDGWLDYQQSIRDPIANIVQNKLFVKSIVSGTPVISNEGPLPGKDYVWRVQIPFLVTYESANTTAKRNYLVTLSVIRVPTNVNPAGIGIDQFLMV